MSDNRRLDIIKLISVIKEVPLPKLGHAGILPAGDRIQCFVLYTSLQLGDNFIQILSYVLIISAIIMRARVYSRRRRVCDLEMLIKGSAEHVNVMQSCKILLVFTVFCGEMRRGIMWILYEIRIHE